MARTTRSDLEQALGVLARMTGRDDLTIEYAYGRPRVVGRQGSVEISPRLSTGELLDWLRAAICGAGLSGR